MSGEFTVKNITIIKSVNGKLVTRVIDSEQKLLEYLTDSHYGRKLDGKCLRKLQKENTELREKVLQLEDDNHNLRIERDILSIENILKE